MSVGKLRRVADGDDTVTFDRRPNTKPYWASRHFDGLYHDPCDDGTTFGDGQMSYRDGAYVCGSCGHAVDYPN